MRNWMWEQGAVKVRIAYSRSGVGTDIFVDDGKTLLVIDAGDGVLRDILDYHIPLVRLNQVIITHNHVDHMSGLLSLFFFLRLVQRHAPLAVYYPPLDSESLVCYLAIYEEMGSLFPLLHRHLLADEPIELGRFSLKPFFVHHKEPNSRDPANPKRVSAVGIKLMHPEATIFYSGDAGYARELEEQAQGADLAIVEATWGNDFEKFATGRTAEERAAMGRTHMTESQAQQVGEHAKQHVLVHRIMRSPEINCVLSASGLR